MGNKSVDLTGKTFGCLTVLNRAPDYIQPNGRVRKMWFAKCICGKVKTYREDSLKKLTSCGCKRNKDNGIRLTKHSIAKTRLYKIYYSMLNRCNNIKCSDFNRYGGRGITICKEWLENNQSFFEWALSHGYDPSNPNLSLERIDVDGNYCPENCTWILKEDQYKNMRKTIHMANTSLADFCKKAGLNYKSVYAKYWRTKDIVYALGLTAPTATPATGA